MKFANIEILYLIWAVPFLTVLYFTGMRRRKRILSEFSSGDLSNIIHPGTGNKRAIIKACLLIGVFILGIVALSGPLMGYRWKEVSQRGVDIIIAIDCSKSMLADDIKPSRLDRAKREVIDLLSMLRGDRAGLVAFAGTAFLQCPLTLDYQAFNIFLNALSPDFIPVGGTNISAAIKTSLSGFNNEDNSQKAVILITDGENTGEDIEKAAAQAVDMGVRIFSIGIGKPEGIPVPDHKGGFKKDRDGKIILTRIDEAILKKIAAITDGAYVRSVAGDMDLDHIYEDQIKEKLEDSTLEGGRKKVWEDRFQLFVAVAIALFLMELLIPSTPRQLIIILTLLTLSIPHPAQAFSTENFTREGVEEYDRGDYEKALKFFIDAQLENPEKQEIYYNIGNAYYKLEDYDAALKNYTRALSTDRKDLKQKIHYNLGDTNYRLENFDQALKEYEKALEIDNLDDDALKNISFVKKMIEQKKQEQKQDKNGQKQEDSENKQDKKGQKDQDQSDGDKQKQKQNSPSNDPGDNNDKEKNDSKQADQPDDAVGNKDDQKKSEDQMTEEKVSKDKMSEDQKAQEKRRAEAMLNRLKDEPGKAMIPAYRQKNIEKDW